MSVTAQVFELLVCDTLVEEHMTMTGQLTECQHCFRLGLSCVAQLLSTLKKWTWKTWRWMLPIWTFDAPFILCLISISFRSSMTWVGVRGPLLR